MQAQAFRARPRRRGLPKDDGLRFASVIAPNVLDREFSAERPNRKWIADFTYVWTAEGWLYVAAVIDLFSRRVVGWSMKAEMNAQLVADALIMAIWRRGKPDALLHHSDQGSQYASDQFQRLMADNGVVCSMSRSGNVWDNAAMESFFSSLKTERIGRKVYLSRDEARADVFDYIERFYNVSSEHTSRYVVDAKRLCWVVSCSAGCFEDLEDSSASLRAVGPLRSGRLKTQGPSGRGWIALTSLRSAASRRVRGATPTTAAAWLRFSQSSSPSDVSRNTGMRWLDRSEVTRSRVQRLP
jgi:putative transposase